MKNISKHDLNEMLIENGVMSAIADWISPLPDKSLPSLNIRMELLRVLKMYTNVSAETLKHSGIGKAVMLLYKHPKEVRGNKVFLDVKILNFFFKFLFIGNLPRAYRTMVSSDLRS